ncbi:hypothetical protein M0R45_026323 [Rubus argutus]|uniref:Uncharacterized protein n=1 Tax=Rubus argutus TaxID=59490 RepID=A0AAW1WXU4_RUBAR
MASWRGVMGRRGADGINRDDDADLEIDADTGATAVRDDACGWGERRFRSTTTAALSLAMCTAQGDVLFDGVEQRPNLKRRRGLSRERCRCGQGRTGHVFVKLGEPITTAGLKTRRGGYGFCDYCGVLLIM